jgi:hypothetical protein
VLLGRSSVRLVATVTLITSRALLVLYSDLVQADPELFASRDLVRKAGVVSSFRLAVVFLCVLCVNSTATLGTLPNQLSDLRRGFAVQHTRGESRRHDRRISESAADSGFLHLVLQEAFFLSILLASLKCYMRHRM